MTVVYQNLLGQNGIKRPLDIHVRVFTYALFQYNYLLNKSGLIVVI